MVTQFGNEMVNNLRDMADKMTTPFLILFGDKGGIHVFQFVQELALGSRGLSQASCEENNCKAEQIHKMTLEIVLDEQNCHFE